MNSILLILALCGDGGYKMQPVLLHYDRAVVQDFVDEEETFEQRQIVIQHRLIYLFDWYDDVGYVFKGWVLIKRNGVFIDNRYTFFTKFMRKWYELRVEHIEYETSNRRLEECQHRAPRTFQFKETGT